MKLQIARFFASLLAIWVFAGTVAAESAIPVLKTKTETYQNVTVVSRTATHVFVQHSRGVANVKIAELNAEALQQLGLKTAAEAAAIQGGETSGSAMESGASGPSRRAQMIEHYSAELKKVLPPRVAAMFGAFLLASLAVALGLYLFYSFCVRLICLKTGYSPGILAWLPVLRDIALIRASGMSAWWFLVLVSPSIVQRLVQNRFAGWQFAVWAACGVTIIVHCYWCIRICQARGKGIAAMIFLIFPLTYPFTFLYLAFSGGAAALRSEKKESRRTIHTEPIPA